MGLIPRSLLRKLFVQTSKRLNWQFNSPLRVASYFGEYTTTRKNPFNSHLYLVKQKAKGRHRYNKDGSRTTRGQSEKIAQREKELWLIITSLQGSQNNAQQIIAYYKTRMQIEESFRDIKSHRVGFSVSESLIRNQARLEILLLIGALATFFIGCQVAKEGDLELEKQEYEMALLHVIDNALAQGSRQSLMR